ncbi:MAG: penicillin-binding transpeptidase domain-containing protein [Eubacteriales bacterium]|nr:penicillin-binding transpeptidase domain-containing protein [Eubacteriales bacterium]
MRKFFEFRYYPVVLVLIVLMAILVIRLFILSVVQHDTWKENASMLSQKIISTSAPRGEILDRYGRLIAGNLPTFSLNFNASNLENEEINNISINIIRILEKNGDIYNDEFPIVFENGRYVYTYDRLIQEWLVGEGIPTYYTAEQAFNFLRRHLGISEDYDNYDAQAEMQNVYKTYPPISVKSMVYLQDLYKKSFLQKFDLDVKLSADKAFEELCKKLEIGDEYSIEDKRKILIVRNEIKDLGYYQYKSASIATDISDASIIEIQEKSSDFTGVEIASETVRYYPNGNTASHIIGYLGKISENNKQKYVKEMGYNPSDMIGQSGIESAYESTLKGTDGEKTVQVNNKGKLISVMSEKPPEKGKDVYLTIDLELQKTAEAALNQALAKIRTAGTFVGKYGNYKYGKAYPYANTGAVVAIDVQTGDVLAMASAPDFNPNDFATGISSQRWQELQSKNIRDSLSPAPLFNVASRTAVQPGSIFKMVVATAALKAGLNPDKKLKDGGFIRVGDRPFNCLVWTEQRRTHGYVDLPHALEVSCNYYFYDIGAGKDYAKGESLGYKMDIGTIMETATEYGLGLPTGIEITEVVAPVMSGDQKLNATKNSLRSKLKASAYTYFPKNVYDDEELLSDKIEEIVSWTEENPSRGELIERLEDYAREGKAEDLADLCKYSYFNQAKLTLADSFNISIGQGENAYTPLQMANYIATIGNRGFYNKVSLIKSIEESPKVEKSEPKKVSITDRNLDKIVEGMTLVANGSKGSLRGIFAGFPETVAAKSGTAQKGGVMQPADEVAYVKSNLRRVNSKLTWDQVEQEINRLITKENYTSANSAVDRAVINLSKKDVDEDVIIRRINSGKREYDNFAWVVAMAPADDPQIAVAVLIVQGGKSMYAAPVAREVLGEYLKLNKEYDEININTVIR